MNRVSDVHVESIEKLCFDLSGAKNSSVTGFQSLCSWIEIKKK